MSHSAAKAVVGARGLVVTVRPDLSSVAATFLVTEEGEFLVGEDGDLLLAETADRTIL